MGNTLTRQFPRQAAELLRAIRQFELAGDYLLLFAGPFGFLGLTVLGLIVVFVRYSHWCIASLVSESGLLHPAADRTLPDQPCAQPGMQSAELILSDGLCLVCVRAIQDGDIVWCEHCLAGHHSDCWTYNQRCAIFGCGCTDFQITCDCFTRSPTASAQGTTAMLPGNVEPT